MAKKKTDKETEPKKISKNRFTTFFKSETTHFVIGLISVIFSVYLLLPLFPSSSQERQTKAYWTTNNRAN
mgnify:CR=1 FL=1